MTLSQLYSSKHFPVILVHIVHAYEAAVNGWRVMFYVTPSSNVLMYYSIAGCLCVDVILGTWKTKIKSVITCAHFKYAMLMN